MSVDGVWLFAFDDAAAGAIAGIASCLLHFEAGHIRCPDFPPALVGHYRIDGDTITCFVRSPQSTGRDSRILQFIGRIRPDAIELHGSIVDAFDADLGKHFGAMLTRQVAAR